MLCENRRKLFSDLAERLSFLQGRFILPREVQSLISKKPLPPAMPHCGTLAKTQHPRGVGISLVCRVTPRQSQMDVFQVMEKSNIMFQDVDHHFDDCVEPGHPFSSTHTPLSQDRLAVALQTLSSRR